jgi:SnoaL-like domain
MSAMSERLRDAQNSHDAVGMADLFATDYASSIPVHPGRSFVGRAQVLKNWTAVFEGVPDFVSDLVSLVVDGDREWAEWQWHGHHLNGSAFAMLGTTIFLIRDGLVAEGRLYMEPLDAAGEDIEAAVRELYKPPQAP